SSSVSTSGFDQIGAICPSCTSTAVPRLSTSAVTSIPDWLSGAVRRRRPRVEISSQRGFPAFVLSSLWNRATRNSSLNVFTVLSSSRAVSGLIGQEVLVDIHLGRALLD